jgi:hypothetical protein
VFIILGGIGGYLWLSHTQKAVQQRLDEENNNQSKEGEE